MNSVTYHITRYGVPYAAGLYRHTGEFVQVFPTKRIFQSKTEWLRIWDIFGDDRVEVRWHRPATATKH
jgi:hypothetical protein